jgi:hypothetical protein
VWCGVVQAQSICIIVHLLVSIYKPSFDYTSAVLPPFDRVIENPINLTVSDEDQ